MYSLAGEGDCTDHPVTLAPWNYKEETLTSCPQAWKFLQEYRAV